MFKKNNRTILIGFFCIFIILFGFSCNTLLFDKAINHVAKNYLLDNNRQLAAHISYRIKSGSEFVSDFADTLSRMPDFLLTEDLLARKAKAMELEGISVLSTEAPPLSSGQIPDLSQWEKELSQIWNQPLVTYIKNSCLIFSAPIMKNGAAEQVVVGIKNYQDIQSLATHVRYKKDSISILFDTNTGERIMQKQGSEPSIKDEEVSHILDSLPASGFCGRSDSSNAFISAEPISGTSWLQVSILPAGLLSTEMIRYIIIYLLLIIAGFLLLAAGAYHFRKVSRKREQAFLHDPLTGGYNREGFLREGSRLLGANGFSSYAVVCFNICEFRHINELWGEESGNLTLRFVYRILKESVNEKELACRSNMDHFILLLRETDEDRISARVQDILARLNNVLAMKFGKYDLNFSIGACPLSMTENLNSAINYSFHIEKQNREENICVFYNEEAARQIAAENQLNEQFEKSLESRDFKVYLQPKVARLKDEPCQAEALVRWHHPEKGIIFPTQFIPMFEENGKIDRLDLYMFEEVCRLISDWIKAGRPVTKISVNVSRHHLRNAGMDIWKSYRDIKEKYRIPDGIIEIELTETMLFDGAQLPFIKQVLDKFRSCGLRVALDDFGFAYSSLALLKEFEVDTLKLDRSFFVNETEKSKNIVTSIIQLAHSLHMSVVAEGSEDEEQVNTLWKNNCDFIQGYFYSRPLPVDKFEEWRAVYEK